MIKEFLRAARDRKATDLHLSANFPPMLRVDGVLQELDSSVLTIADTAQCAEELGVANLDHECDFAYDDDSWRYRINAYLKQDSIALAIRVIPEHIPSLEQLHLPEIVSKFTELQHGLVIVTGPTCSGKTTTLAALVDRINALRYAHIVTLEDPVEYVHCHRRSLVTQREIGVDTGSFKSGLRAALRQDPDVIMVGELRDAETMEIALNAAETGHLVLTTMHTGDSTGAISRILDTCEHSLALVKNQLAASLQGIIAQQLLRCERGGMIAAAEVLVATPALRNLIREDKLQQIPGYIQTGAGIGMQTMEVAMLKLRRDSLIK